MYYIFEWHYKEFHLGGVPYYIVLIGKGDRATGEPGLEMRPDETELQASHQMANPAARGKNANSLGV